MKKNWAEKLTKKYLSEEYPLDKKNRTAQSIANGIGCSLWPVYYYLRKYNIQIKTNSEAHKNIKRTKKWKQQISEIFKNRVISKEWRKKISDTLIKKEICKGKNNPNYKGGKIKTGDGYFLVLSLNHPYRNKQNKVREHRLIVEKYIGRYLTPEEQIYHINGIKDDNRIENLMCFSSHSAHLRFHKDPNNVKDSEIIFDGRKL